MLPTPEILSDHDLVVATRGGSGEAWRELRGRHEPAIHRFASARVVEVRDVDDTFDRLRAALCASSGTDLPSTDRQLRAVRPRLLAELTGRTADPSAVDDEPELRSIATAYTLLPEDWQAVLWHRQVDGAPASEATMMLGRSGAGVLALEQAAERGLFERTMQVEAESGALPPLCRPIVVLLGAYRRSALPPAERRAVEEHLHGRPAGPGCESCRRRLASADRQAELLARALVPWLTGLTPVRYRAAAGLAASAVGAAELDAKRRGTDRRRARVLALVAVVAALAAAALLIRTPFGPLEPNLASLLDRASDAAAPPNGAEPDPGSPSGGGAASPGSGGDGAAAPGSPSGDDDSDANTSGGDPGSVGGAPGSGDGGTPGSPGSPSVPGGTVPGGTVPAGQVYRIELVFHEEPIGLRYVPIDRPLDLSIALGARGPFRAGGTGTIDLALTNNDTVGVDVTFRVRVTDGLSFDQLTSGDASCRADGAGATCSVWIAAGGTAPMSLRFGVDASARGSVRVEPGLPTAPLDVPIVH